MKFSNLLLTAFVSIFPFQTSIHAGEQKYVAVVSCGYNNQHINVLACFANTELKLEIGGRTNLYKIHQIHTLGTERRDGLHIALPEHFRLTVQNSEKNLILGVTIYDSQMRVVFEDKVAKYGVVSVQN